MPRGAEVKSDHAGKDGLDVTDIATLGVHLRLQSLATVYGTYLWVVYFKLDGDTTHLDSNFTLQGRATVSPTPGNHGDVPNLQPPPGAVEPIPAALGEFRTILTPIPLDVPVFGQSAVGGTVGCAVILMADRGTEDADLEAGHQALNAAIQRELDGLIPTLGISHPKPTESDIQGIEDRVRAAVRDAVVRRLGTLEAIMAWLGIDGQDETLGSSALLFSQSDLMGSDAVGLPISEVWHAQNWAFSMSGKVIADPLPRAVRRVLTRAGRDPGAGLRAPLTAIETTSVRTWVAAAS
jgi:hypothetical protein